MMIDDDAADYHEMGSNVDADGTGGSSAGGISEAHELSLCEENFTNLRTFIDYDGQEETDN
jgi:hypothetical protein